MITKKMYGITSLAADEFIGCVAHVFSDSRFTFYMACINKKKFSGLNWLMINKTIIWLEVVLIKCPIIHFRYYMGLKTSQ